MADESKEQQDWKAEFIYIVNIEIVKAVELRTDISQYVKIQCGNRQFITKNQSTSKPEWNEKTQFLFYREAESVIFSLINAANDTLIGQYTLSLTDFFTVDHKGLSESVDIDCGKLDIRVECQRLEPFKWQQQSKIYENNKQQIAKYNKEIGDYTLEPYNTAQGAGSMPGVLDPYITEKKEVEDEYKLKQEQLNTYIDAGKEYDAQIQIVEDECQTLEQERKERKKNILQRMQDYAHNVVKSEDDDAQEEEMDVKMPRAIVAAYSSADKEAKQNDIKKREYDAVGKTEKAEEQDAKLKENKQKAELYLKEMEKWKISCDESYQRDAKKYIEEWSYSEDEADLTKARGFFSNYYFALARLCLNLQIVGATLQEFEKKIKNLTNKRSNKCTLDDLRDKTEGEKKTVWQALYNNHLQFVVDELDEMYPLPPIRERPIKILCEKTHKFIVEAYNGYFPRFCRLISHWVVQHLMKEDALPKPNNIDDVVCATICILFDKKEFCLKLHRSMRDAAFAQMRTKKSDADEDDDEDENQEEEAQDEYVDDSDVVDPFEQIIARIVIAIGRLWDSALVEDILTEDVQKQITAELNDVIEACVEFKIDDKSQQLIRRFFDYFFNPEAGGTCCGGGDEEGASFMARIFGSICKPNYN